MTDRWYIKPNFEEKLINDADNQIPESPDYIDYNIEKRVNLFFCGFATASHHANYYRKYNSKIIYLPAPVISPKKNFNLENIIKERARKNIPIFFNISSTLILSTFVCFTKKPNP